MKKIWKAATFFLLLGCLFWFGSILADRRTLDENIIRLHVVANSDSETDQRIKLAVKDAIVEELEQIMQAMPDADDARSYLLGQTHKLTQLANKVLAQSGSTDTAVVSLNKECFDTRHYDTFSLPAGVYEALRVTIGDGQGHNWWCVVFPTLCAGATAEDFSDTAAGSGFDNELSSALQGDKTYEIRFFLLDFIGRIQNFFFTN